MWEAFFGTAQFPKPLDDGGEAWRIRHRGVSRCLWVKFSRQQDAENAATLMNKRCPCRWAMKPSEVLGFIGREIGNREAVKRYLMEQCCAW